MTNVEELARQPLVPLPSQPHGVPWPTVDWPAGRVPEPAAGRVAALLDDAFDDTGPLTQTLAVVVVHHGRLVAERYGGAISRSLDAEPEPVTEETTLISWSMAKSILHAAVGILVGQDELELDAPAAVPEWQGDGDPRREITLEHLLAMRDGLDFNEDYVDETESDVIPMLFGAGPTDVAHFAADRPLAHGPGEHFNYSSGTSNIVSRIVADVVGRGPAYQAWLQARLFTPIGMRSAEAKVDDAGTFVASSFVYATARDFARFGLLYLRGGEWDGRPLLPPGWVDHGRRPRSRDAEDGRLYGAHWWVEDADTHGAFWANGYEGQSILVVPGLDLVVVRLGKTPKAHYPELRRWRLALIEAFSTAG